MKKGKDEMILALGFGGKKPPMKGDMGDHGPEESPDTDMEDEGDSFDDFASSAMDALKSGDKAAFSEALRGAIESCKGDY